MDEEVWGPLADRDREGQTERMRQGEMWSQFMMRQLHTDR